MSADSATIKHVSAFQKFVSDRVQSVPMMRLALYASHRYRNGSPKWTPQKSRKAACQRCESVFGFETRVQRPRRRGKCKQGTSTMPKMKRICTLCGSTQKDATDSDANEGNEKDCQTTKQSQKQAAGLQSLATPTTPVVANLQKLLTAKKRKSLNEETGLLNFLIQSTT